MSKVQEIEAEIGKLAPGELEELLLWLYQYNRPQPIDERIQADAAAGRLDSLMREAAEDYRNARTRPL